MTQPDDFFDLCRRPNLANVGTLIARHPNDDALSLSVSLSLERSSKFDRIWDEINRKLLFDFPTRACRLSAWSKSRFIERFDYRGNPNVTPNVARRKP